MWKVKKFKLPVHSIYAAVYKIHHVTVYIYEDL